MPLSIFTTTEFYVTVLVVAAAVLAYAAMPASAGAVRQHLVGSSLGSRGRCAPGIEVECLGGGDVVISRRGLDGVFPDGAVSAAISFLRTLVFQIAVVLLLPLILEIDGVWLAVTAAEVMTLLVTVTFFIRKRTRYHYA